MEEKPDVGIEEHETPPQVNGNERNWLIGLHFSPLAMITSIPGTNVLAPLISWLMKRERSPELNRQGKDVINFQISMLIYVAIAAAIAFMTCGFGIIQVWEVVIFELVMVIVGGINTANGRPAKYPLKIDFIK